MKSNVDIVSLKLTTPKGGGLGLFEICDILNKYDDDFYYEVVGEGKILKKKKIKDFRLIIKFSEEFWGSGE